MRDKISLVFSFLLHCLPVSTIFIRMRELKKKQFLNIKQNIFHHSIILILFSKDPSLKKSEKFPLFYRVETA